MSPFISTVLAYLTSTLLVLWCTNVWVPRTVSRYGVGYFGWREAWIPGFLSRYIALAAQLGLLWILVQGKPHAAWPFAALIVIALNGVFQADSRMQIIPDRFQVAGAIGAVGYLLLGLGQEQERLVLHAIAGPGLALGLYLVTLAYEKLRKRDGLGFGDIKMIAWLGLAFGADIALILAAAIVAALLGVIPTLVLRRRTMQTAFAFGPFIVLGVLGTTVLMQYA